MEVMARRTRSGLNPDAAPYVPAAQRAVEDFSSEWWNLVHSSPWFADYWLRECFHESVLDFFEDDDPELPDDINDALFSLSAPHQKEAEEEEGGGRNRELITWGAEKWKASRGCAAEGAKYAEKAAKVVSVKLSPRTIQQPR
ncbi:protein EARLY RESPONSIVE TO DEHYDRATION 15 [Musa acuminata AAA Group]|uniref:protein EARLY RESPONSIVE TO DEHYDRATION 15 n=1 Tax=Musa acuminata AAA Group TaxID=214697 RepID=UPI0031D05420